MTWSDDLSGRGLAVGKECEKDGKGREEEGKDDKVG